MAIFLLCLCLLLSTTSTVSAVNVGAIVNPNTRVGKEQKIAIEIAVEDFNCSATPLFLNLKNSSLPAATTVEDLISSWKADVVLVGTGTWTDETITAEVKNKVQGASRPWFVSIPDNFSNQMQCIADLVENYSWRRVVVIYEEDAIGTITAESISNLSNALRAVGSGIQRTMPFKRYVSFSNPKAAIREGLKELNDDICRVFVVIQASPEFTDDLFQEATALGMMEEGYVWLTNNDITSHLNSSMSSRYAQGVVEVRNYVKQSDPSYQNFLVNFSQRFGSNYGNKDQNVVPGIYALRAYDAIHAVAIGFGKTRQKDMPTAAGFQGLSAFIRFENKSGLSTNGTMFTITNTVGNGYREMGFWSEGIGFHKITNMSNKHMNASEVFGSVYWPGGPNSVPGGWDVLDVIIPAGTSFDEFVNVERDDKGKLKVTGFSIDVFETVLKEMPYELRVNYTPYDGTYDCMVNMVHYSKKNVLKPYNGPDSNCGKEIKESNKSYHAAVGDITILGYRSKIVDFTVAYMETGLSKMVPVRHNQKAFMFLKPFTLRLWLTIVLASLYTGTIVWFLERYDNSEEYKNHSWKYISNGVWFTYLTFFFSQGRLYSNYTKVAILVWLFTTLVLTQGYTASLSSILTVQKLHPVNARGNEQVGCDGDSFVLDYLQNVLTFKKEDIHKIDSEYKYPETFKKGDITSAYLEIPYLRVFLSKYGDDFMVTGTSNKLAGLGFAFDKGSPFTADVNTAILNIFDNGKLKELTEKAFTVDLISCPQANPSKSKDNLDIDSFWFLIALSGGTSTVVFIIFLLKLFLKYRERHCTQARISPDGETVGQSPNEELDTGLEDLEMERGVATRERHMLQLVNFECPAS